MSQAAKHKVELPPKPFDLAIIGGGIYGCSLAWLAAKRGLRVALLERHDFGSGASASSLKIIHGGLRYLQQVDIPRMRESIWARREMLRLFPDLIRPRPFCMPTTRWGLHSKSALRAALLANDVISWDRNRGLAPEWQIARGQVIGRRQLGAISPYLSQKEYTGAALWQDGFAQNTERVTLELALAAERAGAVISNYWNARQLLRRGGQVVGVVAEDMCRRGTTVEVLARCVVNMSGAWLPELLQGEKPWSWVKSYNIVVRQPFFGEYGLGLECLVRVANSSAKREKRNYFFAPWLGGTMIGTIYKSYAGSPETCGLTRQEIEEFLAEINQMYPPAALRYEDVTFVHLGVLPAARGHEPLPAHDTEVIDFGRYGANGYWAVNAIKYTTALATARHVLHKIQPNLGRKIDNTLPVRLELDEHDEERRALNQLLPGGNVSDAVIDYAVRCEHVRHLTDWLLRRTVLGSFCYPGQATVQVWARRLAPYLGWDETRCQQEVATVDGYYRQRGCLDIS